MSRPNQFLSPEGDLEDYFVDEYWLIDQWVGDELWVWGINNQNVLGINNTGDRLTPVTTFAGGTNWKQVASGGYQHTAAIKTDGTLWIWGRNVNGQLGINDTLNRSTPVTTFAGGTNWKQVQCGSAECAAIKTDGTLWTWGGNVYGSIGKLGNNATGSRLTPVTTFAGGTDWKQVTVGISHIGAIKTDGTLWVWGSNDNSGLGINSTIVRVCTPVTTFAGGTNWKQANFASSVSTAIKTDGTLWVWGFGSAGRLGNNNSTNRSTPVTTFAGGTNWKQVAHSGSHAVAIKTDGTLWTWGYGSYGRLGDGQLTIRSTPVTTFAGGTNWKQVSVGYQFSTAIKTDGTLWTWGRNSYGGLGTNDTTQRSTPVTTFAGGTNWKLVQSKNNVNAIFSGTTPDLPLS